MAFLQLKKLLIVATALIICSINWSCACNESVCASVVSKCMLLGSCNCNLETCDCCKDCFFCLNFLYDECCSCFDLCPTRNQTDNSLGKKSHIETYNEPFPELFRALTEDQDEHRRWISITYPANAPPNLFPKEELKTDIPIDVIDGNYNSTINPDMSVNCTVAFMVECKSWTKCKRACQSMGATSYRWFHDGCCECIGSTCLNYGFRQSKCLNCPLKVPAAEEEYDDYGQDDIFDEL